MVNVPWQRGCDLTTGHPLDAFRLFAALYLMTTAGEAVLYVAVPAALMAVFYTADPFSLKAKGLGDLVIFLMFG